MANAGTMAPIRIEESVVPNRASIPDYRDKYKVEESPDPNRRFCSRENGGKKLEGRKNFRETSIDLNQFDQIIEKIENLCFSREHRGDVNRNESLVRTKNRANDDTRSKKDEDRQKGDEDNNNKNGEPREEEDVRRGEEDNEEIIDDEDFSGKSQVSSNDGDCTSDEYEGDTDDSSDTLIERGPIRPQLYPIRGKPYGMMDTRPPPAWTPEKTESIALDYETTAEQILRDKEYSEKLKPCLDQLECSAKRICPPEAAWTARPPNGKQIIPAEQSSATRNDAGSLPSIVVDDPGEDSLLEILSRGGFQVAQVFSDTGSNSVSSPNGKAWPDSPVSSCNVVASRSDSRGSSRAQSPGSGINLESPLMHINLTYSPIGSPQVAPAYRAVQGLSSSSSSNQSYCDTPSPLNYQAPLNPRLEDRLGDELENFPIWNDGYESSGTVVDTADTVETIHTFDSSELQLVEEVLRDLGGRYETEEAQVVPNSQQGPAIMYEQERSSAARCESSSSNNFSSDYSKNGRDTQRNNLDRTPQSENTNLAAEFCDLNLVSPGCDYTRDNPVKGYEMGRQREPQLLRNEYSYPDLYANYNGANVPAAATAIVQQQYQKQQNSPPEGRCDDLQIPEPVASFNSCRAWRNTDRAIMPWPSLNLPSVRASERLKEGLCPKDVERAMCSLLKKPVEKLARADEDGDTELMRLVGNPEELTKKKAYLAPLVERLGNARGALSKTNNRGEDALYLAAMNCARMSYVAGYLAAAMLRKGIDISQRLYHTRGDTLIHSVAARGDSHGEVLAELLALRTVQGNAVFDLSKRNYDGRTALHVAVESHDPVIRGISSVATVRLLLENGADPKIKETRCGDTALHMAVSLSCDPALIKVLLANVTPDVINATNYEQNTPLHMAAGVSNAVSLERQREVCWLLTQAGGRTNLQNRQGNTALSLVSPDRKEAIRRIFYKKL